MVILAVAACVLFMVGRGVAQIASHISCTNNPLVINVAVSADISQPINEIADAFNHERHQVDGRCVVVRINPGSPALAAAQIDGQQADATGKPINAWIPDSSLWVDEVRGFPAGASLVNPAGFSVARSPLMIVMPAAAAARTPSFHKDGWKLLLPPSAGGPTRPTNLTVDLPDPSLDAAGLATLIEESRQFGSRSAARLMFTQFAHNATVTSYLDSAASLQALVNLAAPPLNEDPVTVTTEQAVISYDSANPHQPLAAVYPAGRTAALGAPEFDYPYVLLATTSSAVFDAATAFGQMLRGGYAASVIRFVGFRTGGQSPGTPDQFGRSFGLGEQLLQIATPASSLEAPTALQAWNKLSLWSRDLTLVDVSANMNKSSIYGAPTYEQELSKAATIGLGLFANTADLGLWEFAYHLNGAQPYKSMVPIGPLPAYVGKLVRRVALEHINGTLVPTYSGNVALYGTILDAFKYMQSNYQPKFYNALIVLGSGIENAPGDITGPELVKKLTRLDNPAHKVTIIMVIFGKPANFPELRRIAGVTGGQAFAITSPSQVASVFYQALAHRLCSAGCATP